MPAPTPTALPCPGCSAPLPPEPIRCPRCALSLVGPDARQLWHIDAELAALTSRRTDLLRERSQVISRLRPPTPVPVPVSIAAPFGGAVPGRAPGAVDAPLPAPAPYPAPTPAPNPTPTPARPVRPRRETSALTAQNVLLGLGGLLLAIAAIVFAVVAWSWVGLAGRAGILGLLTVLVGVLPIVLSRRGLSATAETLAQLTLLLVLLDGWAAWHVGLVPILSGAGWAAVVCAGNSLVALGLRRLAPLRGLPVAALVLAQPVPLLVAAGLSAPTAGWLLAGAALAALDTAIAWTTRRTTHVLETGLAVGVAVSAVGLTALSGAVELGLRVAGTAIAALTAVGALVGVTAHVWPGALCLGVLTLALVPSTGLPSSWRRGPAIAVLTLAAGLLLVAAV